MSGAKGAQALRIGIRCVVFFSQNAQVGKQVSCSLIAVNIAFFNFILDLIPDGQAAKPEDVETRAPRFFSLAFPLLPLCFHLRSFVSFTLLAYFSGAGAQGRYCSTSILYFSRGLAPGPLILANSPITCRVPAAKRSVTLSFLRPNCCEARTGLKSSEGNRRLCYARLPRQPARDRVYIKIISEVLSPR